MAANTGQILVNVLGKIPVFKGLNPLQVKKVLALCIHKSMEKGEALCKAGTPSDEMYVLLTGQLGIYTAEGIRVATTLPVTTVGEMGVLTGEPRSASVVVSSPSNIFTISKTRFDLLLREEHQMRAIIYKNIIDVLAGKLNNDNIRMMDYQSKIDESTLELEAAARAVNLEKMRAEIVVDLAIENSQFSREEIEEKVRHALGDNARHVLIVDPDAEVGQEIAALLLKTNHVHRATDYEGAVEVLRAHTIDLLVIDVDRSKMSGLDFWNEVRVQFPDVAAMAISSSLSEEDLIDFSGGDTFESFAEKPIDDVAFCAAIEKAMVSCSERKDS
ncbi:MAG: cyclic nucleotide-binding domain-containing protein [Candidatus Latescibacterota bacterium]|nr:cyclic nucleotide-binding domain-containing protein [Candidatus Latescibacterota bacterium]